MTDKDKTVGGRMIPDDPGMDCTDGAHPAWWRGEEYGANAIIREVGEILDGAYDASGVASEPWEGLRRRLLALVDAHSRGIREGLERAAKIVCRWCREGVESRANEFRYWHQFPDGGTTACPATEVRAEASKLEGSERGRKPLTPAPSTGTVSPRVEESNVQTYQG